MGVVLLYALLGAAAWYLLSRAAITEFAWSRYPRWFARLADCASCAGFWIGVGLAAAFRLDFLGLDGRSWQTPGVVGLCAVVWTPVVALAQQWCLAKLGTAVEP